MHRGERAALIIGSSKIETLIAQSGINDTFVLTAKADKPYSGFSESRFFDEEELVAVITESFNEISVSTKKGITAVYVGVPSAFIKTECRRYKVKLDKKRKIKQKDIDNLIGAGKERVDSNGREIIHSLPINFSVNEKMVLDPIGIVSEELGGYISYVLCDEYFSSIIRKTLKNLGIYNVKFVSEAYAEGLMLLGDEKDSPSVIIDVGYIATSLTLFYGNGIVASEAYDLGGGYINANFVENFDLDLDEAEILKRKLNLGFTNSKSAVYRIESEGNVKEISAIEVNDLTIDILDGIAEVAYDFLERNLVKFETEISVYLTGGGISFIRGAKEHLSSRLGVDVEVIAPKIPEKSKPTDSSEVSLVEYMLKIDGKGEM